MAGEGRQGKVVLIMGNGEELKKDERKSKRGRERKGEVMNQREKVEDKKVKMSSGSTSRTAEVEKLEEKKVRKTRGLTVTAVKVSPRKWPVRERKVVERFSFPPERELASMVLVGLQGKGMKLKDIPNGMEKERAKLKEKIDKCVKECLFDFCELLDILVTKESKKVELSARLLEFLESPHATTDVLLARKRQSKRGDKRTRTVNMIQASSPEELAEVEGSLEERITTEDDVSEYEEHKAESKEQENFLPEEGIIEVKKELEEKEQDTASKKEKATLIKKNPAPKIITEKQQTGQNEAHAEAHAGPSCKEMWDMVTGLLKEVNFDVATFSDILKRLEATFNTSLSNRKAEIRRLIKEAIASMTDDEDEGGAKGGNRVGR
ncbi:hypothetical protein MRB53_007779 [Persea americana]|uniref:Uncharacterized protein n=1 Tax=Persea americana TaxID=3435 RepID=A0ACC2MJU9_PERAE|nr:hypothetical protein MRB53_007779 [Persea americana]